MAAILPQPERVTLRDQGRLDKIRSLTDSDHPTTVTHWLTPQPDTDADPPPANG